jgi:hypothetical protein
MGILQSVTQKDLRGFEGGVAGAKKGKGREEGGEK